MEPSRSSQVPAKGPLTLPTLFANLTTNTKNTEPHEPQSNLHQSHKRVETPASPLVNKGRNRAPLTSKDINHNITTSDIPHSAARQKLLPKLNLAPPSERRPAVSEKYQPAYRNVDDNALSFYAVQKSPTRPLVVNKKHEGGTSKKKSITSVLAPGAGEKSPSKITKSATKTKKPREPNHPLVDAFNEAATTYKSHLTTTLPPALTEARETLHSQLEATVGASNAQLTTHAARKALLTAPLVNAETNEIVSVTFAAWQDTLLPEWALLKKACKAYDEVNVEIAALVAGCAVDDDPSAARVDGEGGLAGSGMAGDSYAAVVTRLEAQCAQERQTILTRVSKELEAITQRVEESEEAYEFNQRQKRRKTENMLKMMTEDEYARDEADEDEDEVVEETDGRDGQAREADEIEDDEDEDVDGEWGGKGKSKGKASKGAGSRGGVQSKARGRRSLL